MLQLAVLGESDPNFSWGKKPIGTTKCTKDKYNTSYNVYHEIKTHHTKQPFYPLKQHPPPSPSQPNKQHTKKKVKKENNNEKDENQSLNKQCAKFFLNNLNLENTQ